jgi:hypothetical protein
VEDARAQRRAILERAQRRIGTLHARGQKALEKRNAKIAEQGQQSAVTAVGQFSDSEKGRAALQRLVTRLIEAPSDQRSHDGH